VTGGSVDRVERDPVRRRRRGVKRHRTGELRNL
jgi:hypothetical protein